MGKKVPEGKTRVLSDIDEELWHKACIRAAELKMYKNSFIEVALLRYLEETEKKADK